LGTVGRFEISQIGGKGGLQNLGKRIDGFPSPDSYDEADSNESDSMHMKNNKIFAS
jgi:hypothetical protein